MIRDGDLWVHQGKIEQPINWQTIIDDDREQRIQAIIGMALLDNLWRRAKGEERIASTSPPAPQSRPHTLSSPASPRHPR
jgi:hypothetical protein